LIVRTAERLFDRPERDQAFPALLVATERPVDFAPLALERLWAGFEKGEPVARVWVPGGEELRLVAPRALRLQKTKPGVWRADWLTATVEGKSSRDTLSKLVRTVRAELSKRLINATVETKPQDDLLELIDISWAATSADEGARWLAALLRLRQRVKLGEMPKGQFEAVLDTWRALLAKLPSLRRPALRPSGGAYLLSWAFDDVPGHVVTLEIDPEGRCEWFLSQEGLDEPVAGEGWARDAVDALGPAMKAFAS
jgi:hypothetical protein